MGVKFGKEEVRNVLPLRVEKPHNRPLSKLYTGELRNAGGKNQRFRPPKLLEV